MSSTINAAKSLIGLALVDDWIVKNFAPKPQSATGGNFSVGYIAENSDGRRAFVKALDYSAAFEPNVNTPRVLQFMTEAFNFEKEVLDKCRSTRMRRVAVAIGHGSVDVPNAGPYSKVDYMIFELADGDARAHIDRARSFDVAWRLRVMHNATIGLRQLHAERIAHQDLKPSNVLIFPNDGPKIADLGRASRSGYVAPHDTYLIPGDPSYSAPELLYGQVDPDFARRRLAPDLFMLGSLGYFFFTGANLTSTILSEVHPTHHPRNWNGDYQSVLSYVRDAFDRAMTLLEDSCNKVVSTPLAAEITGVIRQLCDPEPGLRGDPKNRNEHGNPYSLERFVTRFNVLASRVEMKLKADEPTP